MNSWQKISKPSDLFCSISINSNILKAGALSFCCSGVAGQPCKFTVETNGAAVDNLGFAVEGPHQAEIKCRDMGNGKCEVIYYPTKPGDYTVHITCNGKDIPQSPFTVPITPGGDASKCYAEGPGLEPEGLVSGK